MFCNLKRNHKNLKLEPELNLKLEPELNVSMKGIISYRTLLRGLKPTP